MNHPNRMLPMWIAGSLAFMMILLSTKVYSAPLDQELDQLRQDWAVAKYQTPRKQQDKAFAELIQRADQLTKQNPKNAEAHLWAGTINATYTGIKGGLGALKYAKAARKHLDISLKIDPRAERGLANGVLGALYARLPGWPVAFGDDKKAEQLFKRAVQIDPRGRDSNYYFGDYLAEKGNKKAAKYHLDLARKANVRKGYEVADKGRMREINEAYAKIK